MRRHIITHHLTQDWLSYNIKLSCYTNEGSVLPNFVQLIMDMVMAEVKIWNAVCSSLALLILEHCQFIEIVRIQQAQFLFDERPQYSTPTLNFILQFVFEHCFSLLPLSPNVVLKRSKCSEWHRLCWPWNLRLSKKRQNRLIVQCAKVEYVTNRWGICYHTKGNILPTDQVILSWI